MKKRCLKPTTVNQALAAIDALYRSLNREGQEDQLSALGLVLNAVVLWNTCYMDATLAHLRDSCHPVRDEDATWLSPLGDSHLNLVGRYSFRSATVPGSARSSCGSAAGPRRRNRAWFLIAARH